MRGQLGRPCALTINGFQSSTPSVFICTAWPLSCSSSLGNLSPLRHQRRHVAMLGMNGKRKERREWIFMKRSETFFRRISFPFLKVGFDCQRTALSFRDSKGVVRRSSTTTCSASHHHDNNYYGSLSLWKKYIAFLIPPCDWERGPKPFSVGDAVSSSASATLDYSRKSMKRSLAKDNDDSLRILLRGGGNDEEMDRHQAQPPSPNNKGDNVRKLPNKQDEKKVAHKTGGGDDGDGDGSDSNATPPEGEEDDWAFTKSIRFFWMTVILSGVCWYMGQPKGEHVGWATIKKLVGEIEKIDVYTSYAQVTLISSDGTKTYLYVGLVDEPHTSARIRELGEAYIEGKKKAVETGSAVMRTKDSKPLPEKKESKEVTASRGKGNQDNHPSSATNSDHSTTTSTTALTDDASGKGSDYSLFRHEKLPVVWKGSLKSETCLYILGSVAWVFPFLFLPAYVMVLTGAILRASLPLRKMLRGGGGGVLDKMKSHFKVEPPSDTKFADVAGMKEAKIEIMEIVDFLRHPERYTHLGAKIPTGALLLGPPGTGKTLLAKAVSGESGVSFIPVCGSDFIEEYYGMGAKRIRELFELAKKQRTIIYIDEIDAIGQKRHHGGEGGKHEQEHTLNELLSQLDGFSSKDRTGDIVVLASSNVAMERLDSALIRPGRFDRVIHVDTPVKKERAEIFKVHLSKLKILPDPSSAGPSSSSASDTSDSIKVESATGSSARGSSSGEENEPIEITAVPEKEMKDVAGKGKVSLLIPVPDTMKVSPEKSDTPPPTKTAEKVEQVDLSPVASPMASVEKEKELPDVASLTHTPPLSTCTAIVSVPNVTEEEFIKNIVKEVKEKNPWVTNISPIEGLISMLQQKSKEEQEIIAAYAARMSELCPGCVGADMANMCNEAAILAVQEYAPCVTLDHLERSIDRVLAGIEHRSRILSDFEKKVVAHHEAGHAVAGWFLQRANPLMKVSIVPRSGSALGYAQYLPPENRNQTAKELRDSIAVTLGGRIAEQIFFQHLSTGASDDLDKVRRMAYFYVSSFKSAEKGGGCYPTPDSEEMRYSKVYGDEKANAFDEQAREFVDEIYKETYQLLLEHKEHMSMLAEHLLQEEVLTHLDVVRYLGVRPVRGSDRKPLKDVIKNV